ncbi:Lrp/AsnC ligand binding domain-containing protein [Candidatus Woesearchaeota archaeon]|nr:Lrp/AsnC ligand binding domain-containing protein [Candidatus Woesearchaeota archaeon]
MQKNSKSIVKPVDRKILKLIQDKGLCVPRITKIAHELSLPTSTVQARINKMQELGVIKEFNVLVDPEKLEKNFVAFVFGQAKLGKELDLDKSAKELVKIPQVQEVFFITGDYDYLVKLRVKDQDEYYSIVQKVAKCFDLRGKGLVAPKCFKDSPKIVIES